jgi:RNA polymerase sigma factor (TIGR02999 family)
VSDADRATVTSLLEQVRGGGRADLNRLIEAIYPELRRMAGAYLRRERRDHVLQPTALVNELYLRLASHRRHEWQSRAHFFGATASIMRRILVEHARARKRAKREHQAVQADVDRLSLPVGDPVFVLELDAALDESSWCGRTRPLPGLRRTGAGQPRRLAREAAQRARDLARGLSAAVRVTTATPAAAR